MPLVVRAFPLLPGKEEELRQFAAELSGPRRAEAAEFYGSFSVPRESWHLQQTEHGPLVIGVTEIPEPVQEKANEYAASTRPFDRWFKDKVKHLTGIDPDAEPLGPPTEEIFNFEAGRH
jgi:hypothetical protein